MRYIPSFSALVAYYIIFTCNIIFAAPTDTQKDRQAAIDNFNAALSDSGYNFTGRDIVNSATRLFGWEGCSTAQSTAIYSGWQQSWKMMDAVQGDNLNWNEAAALDYLSPPFINEEEQAAIKNIFDTVVTIRGDSNFNPFKWWLHVRCDDPDKKCPCGGTSSTIAYTTNKDAKSGYARINFCPRYFAAPNLDQVISDNSRKDLPIEHRADLSNYVLNKGRVWFHELLHIDWASGVYKAWHITDVDALFLDPKGYYVSRPIYDPEMCKGLARWKFHPAELIRRNADSLTMYAMAKCVQKAIGKYPHLPLAVTLGDVENPTLFMTGDMSIDLQGKVTINGPQDEDVCQTPDDLDAPGKKLESHSTQAHADATPQKNRVRIVLMQTAMGPLWMSFQDTPDEPIKDFCAAKILAKVPVEGDENNLKFPATLPAFDAHGAKGCTYSGASDLVGGLTCEDGASDIRCWEDPVWGEMSKCDGGSYMLGIKCD
ncbi:Killer toxin subunits alpha/beta [Fusarium austroafricanum]|uniref:Killer toxin subunits alpha/beta n=1 Tax=Fusarium austroafricanum TaxID=2364996 RepID=A0A8H4NAX8_9HYPO|nr:Killer toxin subunits alpha/beta [Fusarium austroafricanum]